MTSSSDMGAPGFARMILVSWKVKMVYMPGFISTLACVSRKDASSSAVLELKTAVIICQLSTRH